MNNESQPGVAKRLSFLDRYLTLWIGSNCEPCCKHHYNRARKLGVSKDDMRLAVQTAQVVENSPASSIIELAEKYLRERAAKPSPCCCGSTDEGSGASDAAPGKGTCC